MGMGLEIYDASGSLKVHLGHRLFKILTIADVGATTTGNVTNDAIVSANNVIPVLIGSGGTTYKNPSLAVDYVNKRVSWDYGSISTGERDTSLKLIVGIY